jgi:hypothetical protein
MNRTGTDEMDRLTQFIGEMLCDFSVRVAEHPGDCICFTDMSGLHKDPSSDFPDITNIDEVGFPLPGRHKKTLFIPDFKKMSGRQILHKETGTEDRIRDLKGHQILLHLVMGNYFIPFCPLYREKNHLPDIPGLQMIQKGKHIPFDMGDMRRSHQKDPVHTFQTGFPGSLISKIKGPPLHPFPGFWIFKKGFSADDRNSAFQEIFDYFRTYIPRRTCDEYFKVHFSSQPSKIFTKDKSNLIVNFVTDMKKDHFKSQLSKII